MIEVLSDLVPTMEHAMQGSIVFAALSHGADVVLRRVQAWQSDRRWAKQDAEWAAIAAATPAEIVTSLEGKVEPVDPVVLTADTGETVKKSKRNG